MGDSDARLAEEREDPGRGTETRPSDEGTAVKDRRRGGNHACGVSDMSESGGAVPPAGKDGDEKTIYTHYGTVKTSERRDHKAAMGRARACHHLLLRHEACVNRYLRFGKESVEEHCGELMDGWRVCFAQGAAQEKEKPGAAGGSAGKSGASGATGVPN
eukprot:CAMPEP_0180358670 /NCGR_PEP_ID=MMETSP0989-20121125/10687_1 /TAXON_ID=697907 /ORGANISM="non described non described, Strain CCMP2293" /LENGTH=158 /DNA_ID=CAMNT_0022349197 /DNA_START=1 /DNA_END=478 /DNA_ORIENTATION=-